MKKFSIQKKARKERKRNMDQAGPIEESGKGSYKPTCISKYIKCKWKKYFN